MHIEKCDCKVSFFYEFFSGTTTKFSRLFLWLKIFISNSTGFLRFHSTRSTQKSEMKLKHFWHTIRAAFLPHVHSVAEHEVSREDYKKKKDTKNWAYLRHRKIRLWSYFCSVIAMNRKEAHENKQSTFAVSWNRVIAQRKTKAKHQDQKEIADLNHTKGQRKTRPMPKKCMEIATSE